MMPLVRVLLVSSALALALTGCLSEAEELKRER